MKRIWAAMTVLFVWGTVATALALRVTPIPVPDFGHRAFGVTGEKAARALAETLQEFGLAEKFTFDAGPTHQLLLSDQMTVLIWFDEQMLPNGLSLPVSDPLAAAMRAAQLLQRRGFTATVRRNLDPRLGDKLVVVESDAFRNTALVFRRHVLAMGTPPSTRRITP